jgi:hypothetical protein
MKRLSTILFSLLLCPVLAAQVIINEVMQSNIDCTMDDLNEFPDSWVELYNMASSSTAMLSNYSLGTLRDGSDAYQLPMRGLVSHGYVLVYCDKEATGMHTSFRIDSGKGASVYLFGQEGEIVDSVFIEKKQPAPNISYGRETSGSDVWGYQYTPTPSAENCGQICTEILGEPVFSEPGHVMTSSQTIELTLSLPEGTPEGTEIRYTIDGSEPTTESQPYTSPIRFSSTRVIRAKLFCQGYLSPRSTTQSYIFMGREMTLPVVSIVTNNKYFNDSKIGIYVNGSYSSSKRNYEYDWRRPINFEFFTEADSASQLNQLCETRVAGAASRGHMLKTLAVYANKRFGEKHLKYEFFPDQRPGLKKYKSIMLRNAGNDFDYLYMRDAICQRTMASHGDLDWQAWQPAIFFLNGTYKGILNIRERSNASNIYTNYDGLEDIDMVENWKELKEGTWDNYNAFVNFYNEQGHTLEEYENLMDINEYIDLMVMNLYYNNFDFPGNNFMMWRPREEGGRWRFVAKDADYVMGLYGQGNSSYQIFKWLYNPTYDYSHNWGANSYNHTLLFRRLMENEDFMHAFTDRCAIYMGDFLNLEGTWEVWEPMYKLIKTEYPIHRKLINQWWPNYDGEITSAKNWLKGRTSSFYSQVAEYYSLGTPIVTDINKLMADTTLADLTITFNGIPLSKGRFDGKYFPTREVTIEGSPTLDEDGNPIGSRIVTGWTVVTYEGSSSTPQHFDGSTCHFTMPASASRIAINASFGQSEGLEDISIDHETTPTDIYDLNGNRHDALQQGVNIIRMPDGTVKKVFIR